MCTSLRLGTSDNDNDVGVDDDCTNTFSGPGSPPPSDGVSCVKETCEGAALFGAPGREAEATGAVQGKVASPSSTLGPRNREKPRCRSRPGRRLYARWGGGQPRGRCTYIHKQTNGQARWGIRLNKQERPRTRAFRACPLPWLAGFRAPLSRGQCTGEFCGGGFTRVGARTRALGFLAESPK